MIRAPFQPLSAFAPPRDYRLLPLRFDRLFGDKYLVTNDVGEYVVLERGELDQPRRPAPRSGERHVPRA